MYDEVHVHTCILTTSFAVVRVCVCVLYVTRVCACVCRVCHMFICCVWISDLSSRDRKVDLLRSATRDSGCDKPQISDLSSRDRKVAYLRFEPVILGAINLKSQISNLGTEVRP